MTATVRMTPVVTTAIGGARLCHCRNGIPGTIGHCISKAGSQGPVVCESPLFFVPVSLFWESTEIETLYQTNLDCHLAHTFSWHGPKASTASLPSKQNPKFCRTTTKKSAAVMQGAQHKFIIMICGRAVGRRQLIPIMTNQYNSLWQSSCLCRYQLLPTDCPQGFPTECVWLYHWPWYFTGENRSGDALTNVQDI